MKYRFLIIFFFIFSCSLNNSTLNLKTPYISKGFAYIYSEKDVEDKIIKGKLNNSKLQISHNRLKINTLIKLINPKTNDVVIVKNIKQTTYPELYKILITEKVAERLNLDKELPLIEIIEIRKNKSFIAKKSKIFNEEKKISSNAPVTAVQISNISKNKKSKTKLKNDKIYIVIATFYSQETAIFLKQRIVKEFPNYDIKKLKIKKKSNKEINLISGPYNGISFMKNDYSKLKKFGFEELEISINE